VVSKINVLNHPINIVCVFMKTVIAEFILNPQQNKNAARHSHGKACEVDEGVDLVA
jgi:hypothetical protein